MPGPFPGMDPYLEKPSGWITLHNGLISRLCETLNRLLPSKYVARMGERCQILPTGKTIYPDALVWRSPSSPPAGQGNTAVLTREETEEDAPLILEAMDEVYREPYIEIILPHEGQRVVTTIEILSPVNKEDSEGRASYLHKQQEILHSRTHLIEIDLLRAGPHTVAAPLSLFPADLRWNYLVCLHRAGEGSRFEVWPNSLRHALPRIRIPLESGEADLQLDMQEALNHCYDAGAYSRQIDYAQEPIPPLSPEESIWADALLREKGVRS